MAAEMRAAVQDGIDSGPSLEADAVFASLRARFGALAPVQPDRNDRAVLKTR